MIPPWVDLPGIFIDSPQVPSRSLSTSYTPQEFTPWVFFQGSLPEPCRSLPHKYYWRVPVSCCLDSSKVSTWTPLGVSLSLWTRSEPRADGLTTAFSTLLHGRTSFETPSALASPAHPRATRAAQAPWGLGARYLESPKP